MKIVSSRFERAATRAADEPAAPGPDLVFVGRSNVGKSSLINRLLGVRGLARTSSRPGRTQSVNFYRVNESCYFVDLPGYGWARVPEAVRRRWKPMVEGFFERRCERIALALVVVDARLGPTPLDRSMRDWLEHRGIPWVVAATKADKLSTSRRGAARTGLQSLAGAGGAVILVSAETGLGIRELWRQLDAALAAGRERRLRKTEHEH